jgi:hypothetical protein
MSTDAEFKGAAQLDFGPPRRFRLAAVLIASGFGVISMLPILLAILGMSLLKGDMLTLLIHCLVLLLAALAVVVFLLPLGFGNPYVTRLVRSFYPAAAQEPDGFVVQLKVFPRLRTGLRALIEDADDIGYLSFKDAALVYHGDSVRLTIPFARIERVDARNIGPRGLYLYGQRIVLDVSGPPNFTSLEFTERSSWLLPGSKRITRRLRERLCAQVPQKER